MGDGGSMYPLASLSRSSSTESDETSMGSSNSESGSESDPLESSLWSKVISESAARRESESRLSSSVKILSLTMLEGGRRVGGKQSWRRCRDVRQPLSWTFCLARGRYPPRRVRGCYQHRQSLCGM